MSTPWGSTCHTSQPPGILFMYRILCSQYFKTYSLVLRATCSFIFLLYNQHHWVFAGWANFFFLLCWEFCLPGFLPIREMFPSTCRFPMQFYNSHPNVRQTIATLHSQHQPGHLFSTSGYGFDGQRSYDALYRPGLSLQQQQMTSIPAADSSRAFTIIFNSDEQECILGRMRKMLLISDSTTKELGQHHVQQEETSGLF